MNKSFLLKFKILIIGILTIFTAGLIVCLISPFKSNEQRSSNSENTPIGELIDENVDPSYIIPAGTSLYLNADTQIYTSIKLLNVEAFMGDFDINNNHLLTINGEIDFGFFIDFNYNTIHINGINNAKIAFQSVGTGFNFYFYCVFVGSLTNPLSATAYSGTINLDKNISFFYDQIDVTNVSETGAFICHSLSQMAHIYINSYFKFKNCNNTYFIYIMGAIDGYLFAGGTFFCVSKYGLHVGLCANSTLDNAKIVMAGYFFLTQFELNTSAPSFLIYITNTPVRGEIDINGIYSLETNSISALLYTISTTQLGDYLTLNLNCISSSWGTATQDGGGAPIFIISTGERANYIDINYNNVASMIAAAASPFCAPFYSSSSSTYTEASINFHIPSTEFFSNRDCWINNFRDFTFHGEYKYNWINVNNTTVETTVGSMISGSRDENLSYKIYYDNYDDANVGAFLIDNDGKNGNSKFAFNESYREALKNYIKQNYCPDIVKPWIQNIVDQIVL